jgi:predicted dehydrogenase
MAALRIAIVGYGKIAADQHAPAIAGNPRFELAAVVSRGGTAPDGVPSFASHQDMLAKVPDLDAVAICTPPSVRYAIARDCLEAGLHTLLEKPPGISIGEVEELARLAEEKKRALFTTWHAQYHATVEAAAAMLASASIASLRVVWHEDVRKWHPGQAWIWEPGGFGVFDPGINALSILSRTMPQALLVRQAELFFPANRQTPIAATLEFASPAVAGSMSCDLDWRHSGAESWTIQVGTADGGEILLSEGGARLSRNGEEMKADGPGEYPAIYDRFAGLAASGESHVDLAPLRIMADAFLLGRRSLVEPFES